MVTPSDRTARARLVAVNVGLPRTLGEEGAADLMDRRWSTGFFKEPVHAPVRLGTINLAGGGQADLRYHGGPETAVCVYPAAHYPFWRAGGA